MDYYKIRELAYPYNYAESIAAIFFSITGTILSTLVLHIILKNKWKNLSVGLKLICFTLVFDILHSFVAFTCGICNLVGFADYLNSKLSCTLNAVTIVFTCITSINIVGVVALERYFLIVKDKVLYNNTYYLIVLSLQMIILLSCVISGAFGSFSIGSTSVYCVYDTTTWAGIAGTIIIVLSISISISMTYFSYISIIVKRRKLTLQNQNILPFNAKKIKRDANVTIIKSGLIIFASTFANLPYIVYLFIELIDPKYLTPKIQTICTISSIAKTKNRSLE
ncbi:hypothetical protein CONCODRAFT_4951 [Conidiobolus coronatus NRRL 28638]|uniref:G-protein coupled receptors family 1 profile domain-containing protein n=1 Tax=Conidiobolus coronatus (strain ATCC 28846 / CBS 209.66 / NRRL 28638) TaxID=796925 RepID=A0A137PB52_CONC2|nr:hypothetical protein CONCODRAFT_4951 [Conidiobolus coronatus NRRL 28638]|eukprot:KXN72206.1 hypothetical protein CONCODRAFT_4951 [Conidiobolus coronatus NRRL 28638]